MDLNDYERGYKRFSIELPFDLWRSAKANLIEFKKACNFGVRFLLAEKDGGMTFTYPSNSLQEKIEKLTKLLQKKNEECEALRDQLNNDGKQEDARDEADRELDRHLSQPQ